MTDRDPAVSPPCGQPNDFTAISYLRTVALASAQRFRDLLADRFEEVVPGRTIWRNTPPAFVLHARRPRPAILSA